MVELVEGGLQVGTGINVSIFLGGQPFDFFEALESDPDFSDDHPGPLGRDHPCIERLLGDPWQRVELQVQVVPELVGPELLLAAGLPLGALAARRMRPRHP